MKSDKPRLFISQCLGFAPCRWNGVTIPSELIDLLKPHVEIITVCPEVEIGLGVPRDPIRILGVQPENRKLFQQKSGKYFTKEMVDFSRSYISKLENVDGFILKSKSPSCGIKDVKIYPREGKVAVAAQGNGFFGGEILKAFPNSAIEDEARLMNFRIREHFLTKFYTIFRLRQLKENLSMKGLVEFHTRHKLIFMAYNQKMLYQLGRIVANNEKRSVNQLILDYEKLLINIFEKLSRFTSQINVLMHAFGYISKKIKKEERRFFLGLLDGYRNGNIPQSVPLEVMRSYLFRFNETYLLSQYYFDPFPSDLVQITDSGKGRKLKS